MKTTMRFFAALAIMMGFAMSANSQTTANANIQAKAEVMAGVTVTKVADLDFKNVVPGVVKTIDLNSTVSPATTATGGEATGNWTITKGAKTQVTVSINTASNTVLKSGETNSLPITYTGRLRIGDTASPTSQVAISDFTNTATANAGSTVPFFEAAGFNVDLGGTVTPSNTQSAGTYSADITLTATYN